jgi:hypothetical protein
MSTDDLDGQIRAIVDRAPKLTAGQRGKLAALLAPAGDSGDA